MLSKTSIVRCCAILIIFAVGVSFALSEHDSFKARLVDDSAGADSGGINVPNINSITASNPNALPVFAIAPDTASVTVNAATSQSKEVTSKSKVVISKGKVQAVASKSELNNYVLEVIPTYKEGRYPYLLNNDYENYNGVTENIIYKGSLIARANPDGSKSSHCVGLTYEVFFKAMKKRNKEAGISSNNFNNMTLDNMKDFLLTWYAAKGNPKSEGNQLAGAIVKYGLGIQITRLEDAKAGDFIDFSRTKSGHTAVFINWVRDSKGNIAGFKYWSTQDSTNGIGYKEEYFSDNAKAAFRGTVNRKQLYIGRVGPMEKYRSF
jgi:hypothetical protein